MIRTVLATLAAVLALAAPAAASGFPARLAPGPRTTRSSRSLATAATTSSTTSLDLDYVRATNQLDGRATIARAGQSRTCRASTSTCAATKISDPSRSAAHGAPSSATARS